MLQKGSLLLGMHKIAHAYNFKLISFIHTCVQDGKGYIDAHFATAMRHVNRFCDMGNNVITSHELVMALRANGGINNSVAEMIGINRVGVHRFEEEYAGAIRKLDGFGEHMEARFNMKENVAVLYQYSKFGDGEHICLMEGLSDGMNCNRISAEDEEDDSGDSSGGEKDNNDIVEDRDDDVDEDIGIEELSRGKITCCIIYGFEEKYRD